MDLVLLTRAWCEGKEIFQTLWESSNRNNDLDAGATQPPTMTTTQCHWMRLKKAALNQMSVMMQHFSGDEPDVVMMMRL